MLLLFFSSCSFSPCSSILRRMCCMLLPDVCCHSRGLLQAHLPLLLLLLLLLLAAVSPAAAGPGVLPRLARL